jgi:DNA-binding NtrC family response regulator
MPAGQHVLLAADDQRLGTAVAGHLRKAAGHPTSVHKFAAVRTQFARDREELLVLALAAPDDLEQARWLVQEISLQKLPITVALVAAEGAATDALPKLEPHVARVFKWPKDSAALGQFVKSRPPQPAKSDNGHPAEGSKEAEITRQLLAWTPSLLPLAEKLALAAEHDVTVLLTGETGTGKTFLARLIHDHSPRRNERFLIVPCGALAPNLVESELFGHTKGAFTGADRARIGKFAAAGNGTLLLDEIDALPLEQQANLLRVIETGEYEPVGSNETHKSTCRIIVASNWNLKEEVTKGHFRQDLYYRFNVMSFHLPPLRERIQDIGPLVRGMAARFNTKFRKDLFDISSEAMAALESYSWPGNIRELENSIQHAVLVSQGPLLLLRHLPEAIQQHAARCAEGTTRSAETLAHNREIIERSVIQRALANNNYSRARAAMELGISRVTLYKKMKKHGLLNESSRSTMAQ